MAVQTELPTRASRKSWAIWLSAAAVYLIAVFHRTSFGVAGLEAAERFGVGAAALATFTVLQVGVYAAMQIPTGLLVDRFGTRNVLTAALVFLGLGQVLLALAQTYWLGLVARGVLGLGDALTFVSVLRLAANHFPARRYTLIAALTGSLGFVGNLAATVPLTLLLDGPGWTATFGIAGAATLAYVLVVRFSVRDAVNGQHVVRTGGSSPREVGRQVATAWRVPGTRLGFWTHFSTMFAPATLGLLWGMPFLVDDQGYSTTTASSLLTVFVIGAMVGGPVVGAYIGHRPEARMALVFGYLTGALLVWVMLVTWPGQIPLVALIIGFGFLSLGGPASGIGFALARDYNPLPRVGTATGVVNVGGFTATTLTMLGIGVLLELTGGDYRIALAGVIGVLLVGSWRMTVWFRRARAAVFQAEARGEDVPVQLRHRRWDAPAPTNVAAVS